MTYPFIPEGLIPITVGEPRLGNSAISEWINVSEAEMVWIDCYATVAAAAAIVCTPLKAYAAAGTGSAVLGFNAPIWAGTHVAGAALTLTAQTDAANFTTAATAGVHRVIFQIDVAALGKHATLGDYKYLSCTVTGLVADYVACTFWVKPRHQQKNPASTRWIV